MEENEPESLVEENKPALTFSFSKKISSRKLQSSTLNEDDRLAAEEREFVTSVQDKEVQSTKPKEEKNVLVIPLIQKNNWRKPVEDKYKKIEEKIAPGKADLESQAVDEILKDAQKRQELWEEDGTSGDPNLAIPLVVQNKLPEGYETDEKLDVSLRPEEPDVADYEEVPIDQYGLAMLRGMGWKPGQGLGNNKTAFTPVESILRPKGMGLGADKSQALQLNDKNKRGAMTSSRGKDEEELVLKKNAYCFVETGPHKDLYGIVEGLDEDNARVMVKLSIGGKTVTLSQYGVKLVKKKEYEKYSKYLNKGKVDRFREKEDIKKQKREDKDRDRERRDKRSRDRDSDRLEDKDRDKDGDRERDRSPHHRSHRSHRDKHHHKYKKRKHANDDEQPTSKNSHSSHRSTTPPLTNSANGSGASRDHLWLKSQIRVRIIDRNYKNGEFYNSKVAVVDVLDISNCICKTAEGTVLECLSQSMLETVVPKSDPSYVLIVNGKYRGQLAEVIGRNKKSCQATVQLLRDRDMVIEVDYDSICEFVGNIDEEFDY